MRRLDLRLCVLTEAVRARGRAHEDVAAAALRGGATMIQFRDKSMDDATFRTTAERLLRLTRAAEVPLIVNDRAEIAVAIGADGVHIGRNDGDARRIRAWLPHGTILGVSATCYDEAVAMDGVGADYLGVGPIFPTGSKADAAPPMGLAELQRAIRSVRTPVMAIGGVCAATLPACIAAGVRGAAVISAVTRAEEMSEASEELMRLWVHALPLDAQFEYGYLRPNV